MTELPDDVVTEAARLTRLARDAIDHAEASAYRSDRDDRLAERGYAARVREEDDRAILVCYPVDWEVDGIVDPEHIDDIDRAVERQLTGAGDPDDWETVDEHNRELADSVEASAGPVHGANANAFADFMGNHYARRIETAGKRECREFLDEYLIRNAWPSDEQLAVAEESLELVFETADVDSPPLVADDRGDDRTSPNSAPR